MINQSKTRMKNVKNVWIVIFLFYLKKILKSLKLRMVNIAEDVDNLRKIK